jgi:hypothetical protein
VSLILIRAEAFPRRGLVPAGTVSTSYVPLKRGLSADKLLITFKLVFSESAAKMSSKEKSMVVPDAVLKPIFPMFRLVPLDPARGDPEAEGVTSLPPK